MDFKPIKSTFLSLSNTSITPFISAFSTPTKLLCHPMACHLYCLWSTLIITNSFLRSKLSLTPIVLTTALNISSNRKAIQNQIILGNPPPISKHNPISKNFISATLLNQALAEVLGFNWFLFLVLLVLVLLCISFISL